MYTIYDFYNLIGRNIKKVRKEHGDSQEKLAEKLDMSRGYISQVEGQGIDTGLSLDLLYNISQLYEIDIRTLLDGYEKFLPKNNIKELINRE